MSHLESIPLKDVTIYRRWAEAPNGTLLQIWQSQGAPPIVVMRCELLPHGLPPQCILHLEGDKLGEWEALASNRTALNVSKYFEIEALGPAPREFEGGQIVGDLFVEQGGAILMWAGKGDIGAFICMNASREHSVGKEVNVHDPHTLYRIGRALLINLGEFAT
jgi:hypothetical protein